MRDSVREAVGETVRDMIRSGLKPSFTKKELDSLGVEISDQGHQEKNESQSDSVCEDAQCESVICEALGTGKQKAGRFRCGSARTA